MINARRPGKPCKIAEQLNYFKINDTGVKMLGERNTDHAVIIVHGYNSTLKQITYVYDGLGFFFNRYKPTVDVYGFTWASKGKTLYYYNDLIKAWKSTHHLHNAIAQLKLLGYKKVSVLAHSMGCYLTENTVYKHGFKKYLNDVILQGGDTFRWKFRKRRCFGRIHERVEKLHNFYSKYDLVVKILAKMVRFFTRIGEEPIIKGPANYINHNANDHSETRVRHKDYKDNPELMKYILTLIED
jgi:esterase/lipase superfamily enzyme